MLNILPATKSKRKRVGRGGSRGGTSGKGHKGQRARSGGGVRPLFEGGQTALNRRMPKRGFSNARFTQKFDIINLSQLENVFASDSEITREALVEARLVSGKKGVRVKLLGRGELSKKLVVHVDACSQSALNAIKQHGGEVHTPE